MQIPAVRAMFGSYRVAVETLAIVAVLVGIREVIWNLGITGMSTTPLASSIIGGGVFVMGLVVAGTLSTTATPSARRPTSRRACTPCYGKPRR